jgi:hypothetical protein
LIRGCVFTFVRPPQLQIPQPRRLALAADRLVERQCLGHRGAQRFGMHADRLELGELSSLEPGQTWGVAMVSIDGLDSRALSAHMMDKYRIVVNAVTGGTPPTQRFDYSGLRVTPNVYTTLEEIDTFADAMLDVAKNGLSAGAVATRGA